MHIQCAQGGCEALSLDGVTCVVPVWNCEKYVSEALDSIASQTYPCTSVIVVDDGSTDRTNQMVSDYKNLDIHYIRQINAGPAAARNLGLSQVHTEFVAFLDADDVWHREKLEIQISYFHNSPKLELCVSHIQNFWSPELPGEAREENPGLLNPWIGYVYSALLARRSVFDRVGLLNSGMRHGEDTDWFVRSVHAGVLREVVPQVLTYRRLHPDNLSRKHHESRDALLRTVKQHLDWKRSR